MQRPIAALLVVVAGGAHAAGADTGAPPVPIVELTLRDALRTAAERAPAVLAARRRVAVAGAHLLGARAWLADNPTASAGAAARVTPNAVAADLDVAIAQSFDIAGRQGARRDAAQAELEERAAIADEIARSAMRQAGDAFIDALAAAHLAALGARTLDDATALVEIARRRLAAGDASAIDARLAEAQASRARAARAAADAAGARTLGALRVALGLAAGVPLRVVDAELAVPALAGADQRSDIRAMRAALVRVHAEQRDAEGAAWPTVELSARYALDDGDHIGGGGLAVQVPVFARGQSEAEAARAEGAALGLELAALTTAAAAEAASARAALEHQRRASAAMADAVASARDAARLARQAYDAGESSLAELLVIEREARAVEEEQIASSTDEARHALATFIAEGGTP